MFATQPKAYPAPVSSLPTPPPSYDDHDVVDLRDYLEVLLAGRWIIIALTALVTSLGVGYTLLQVPIYEAEALVQVEDQRSPIPGFEELAGFAMPAVAEVETEVLLSRFVLGQVVDSLHLQTGVEPLRFPVVGSFFARRHPGDAPAQPRFGLSKYAWGGEEIQVDRLEVKPSWYGQTFTLVAGERDTYSILDPAGDHLLDGQVGMASRVSSQQDGESSFEIFVSRIDARPGTHFEISLNDRLRTIKNLRSNLSIKTRGGGGIIALTLQGASPEQIRRILDGLANTYLRQHVERGSAEARSSLTFLEEQLPQLREQLEAAEREFNDFRRDHQAVDLAADTQSLLSRIVGIEATLAQLELEMVEKRQRFGQQHPTMQTLISQRNRLVSNKEALEKRVDALPDRQQAALRLRREVDVASELYTSLLNTAQELKVVQAGTIGNVRILDHAAVDGPVKPRKALNAALSLVLGLMMGMGVVFLRQALHRTVDDPDTLEQALGLPVYTVIPHSRIEAKAKKTAKKLSSALPILAHTNPQDPAVEGLRSFRTSLHFALMEKEGNTIAITSPHPSSGKSFVSINTGHVFAEADKRVLVIDADLRRGCLHEYLGRERGPGLSDVLSGQAEPEEAIYSLENSKLQIMPTGALPPNPSELLMGPRWTRLLDEMKSKYDLIIVDTPPILAVTDAAIIGVSIGALFLLVRGGKSRMEEIESSVRRVQHNDVQVAGTIFNDMGAKTGSYGYYRYQHYYRYDYTKKDAG